MPADAIYRDSELEKYAAILATCHIYLIGFVPTIKLVAARQENGVVATNYEILGKVHELRWEVPPEYELKYEDGGWFLANDKGEMGFFSDETACKRLNDELGAVDFEVVYVGQAYGKDGSRSALTRLQKHETLQKIALSDNREGFRLTLLLLEIENDNRVITHFNPHAKDSASGEARIALGLDKLFNTSEAERVMLYEASLIRYFQPKYNKEFKDSFPSTRMKVLQDCYEKDFAALVAEISIDMLPFKIFSETVPAKLSHMALHHLHEDEARKAFFSE